MPVGGRGVDKAEKHGLVPDIEASSCYIAGMTSTLTKLAELTSQLSDDERELVESKLMATAEALVAATKANASERDTITERSLSDITAGRTIDLAEFNAEMDTFMDELDQTARA